MCAIKIRILNHSGVLYQHCAIFFTFQQKLTFPTMYKSHRCTVLRRCINHSWSRCSKLWLSYWGIGGENWPSDGWIEWPMEWVECPVGELIHEVRQSEQTNSEGAEGGGDQRTNGGRWWVKEVDGWWLMECGDAWSEWPGRVRDCLVDGADQPVEGVDQVV